MVLDRYLVAKGLVGMLEIVFNQPVGHPLVEGVAIGCHVAHLDEFPLHRAIDSLIHRIVLGRPRPWPDAYRH